VRIEGIVDVAFCCSKSNEEINQNDSASIMHRTHACAYHRRRLHLSAPHARRTTALFWLFTAHSKKKKNKENWRMACERLFTRLRKCRSGINLQHARLQAATLRVHATSTHTADAPGARMAIISVGRLRAHPRQSERRKCFEDNGKKKEEGKRKKKKISSRSKRKKEIYEY